MSEFIVAYHRSNDEFNSFAHTVDFTLMPATEDIQKAIAEVEGWKPEEVVVHNVIPQLEPEDLYDETDSIDFLNRELRDEFAQSALTGLCMRYDTITKDILDVAGGITASQFIATTAYMMADAMLKAREVQS